jgi:hypothetical protein
MLRLTALTIGCALVSTHVAATVFLCLDYLCR